MSAKPALRFPDWKPAPCVVSGRCRRNSVTEAPKPPRPGSKQPALDEKVGSRAARKLRHRKESQRAAWFGLGMFGLVGWSVAIPTIIGIFIGAWLDRRWPGQASWTLTFLIVGAALGCLNAWYWIKQESKRD
jgi:ATP synthase protein I